MIRQEKEKSRAAIHLNNRQKERTSQKRFIYGSQYDLITKFPNPPKENKKWQNQLCFYEKFNCACDNDNNNRDQSIYASMARMSGNGVCPSESFGDS